MGIGSQGNPLSCAYKMYPGITDNLKGGNVAISVHMKIRDGLMWMVKGTGEDGNAAEKPAEDGDQTQYPGLQVCCDSDFDFSRHVFVLVGLDPGMKKHVGKYSLGMRQRLGIAQALMEDPDILLLDEPLSGLDNDGVKEMYQVLLSQKEKGKLIVIASHSNEDIAVLCNEIFRFDKGRIVEHMVVP